MSAACRLKTADLLEHHDSALTAVNKLARTFALQMEALKKHRSTGEQTVRVVHQQIAINNQGGHAIVAGEVQAGGGGAAKSEVQSLELEPAPAPSRPDACSPALLSAIEAVQVAMPGTSGSRQDCVSLPRGESGSAEG